MTRDKRVLAWGNSRSFSNKLIKFYDRPIDVTEEYGGFDNIQLIKSGRCFTVVVGKDNSFRFFGEA